MSKTIQFYLCIGCMLLASACVKDDTNSDAKMQFQFAFDATQQRLNNLGEVATIPQGHATQTPTFKQLSLHYIELTPNKFTPFGGGFVAYEGPQKDVNNEKAIDFDNNIVASANEVFQTISIKDIPPGTYEYIRASVAYQKYDIKFNINNIPLLGNLTNQTGTVASFLGFNTYISKVTPNTKTIDVNAAKKQGFWVFETSLSGAYAAYNNIYSGEAPAGATTVVNPLAASSPVPAGSCVITGKFATPLVVTGNETEDIKVTMSFSINQSLEWIDNNGNQQLDWDVPNQANNDKIVDMGLRGLVPSWE